LALLCFHGFFPCCRVVLLEQCPITLLLLEAQINKQEDNMIFKLYSQVKSTAPTSPLACCNSI
jgi:hypothetical protein